MTCNWIEIPLGDFIELKRGYDLPKSKRLKGDKPIISSAGLSDYHSESKVTSPGVVTGRYGTIGEVFYIEEDFWPLNTTLYVKDFKGNCPEFVYYLLKTFDFHKYSDKAAVPGVNRNHLHMEKVCVPSDYVWQERIASYISKFDKKITLNAQVNQTLEEMAQAIFKSWFVDFDPVKAKMNGEQPEGMDAATALLFPEKFVESEKGLIPDGWKIAQVKELCKLVQNGGTPKRKESDYWIDGTINWFTTSELSDSPLIESKEKISELGLAKSSVKMWPKGTVLIAIYAAPTVGRLGILSQEAGSNQACTGLIPKTNEVGHYLFNSLYFARGWLNNISVGAAQQNISKGIVESLEIVIPSDELIESFGCHVETLWQKRLQLQKESQCLANLRDILLPKLLSGEIAL
ncbi:type I restriction enzyme, S subunit [Vibrio crassostreae]|uniref:restriction endonuclease subunit S n=2 Tax=Vibrio TaxID=662 RepID=UPI001048C0F2|nr:restriction endonuclease subunit S [Vibrio crassostreae]TCL22192.1 type I restriction enzyme S subunit [Vibrio crassostreae]CAK2852402.1 type I restriction enzyme, S subunit [Vibrio crassostreae]CAK3471071.1 type I restriction enzyme, S subunit [Vibrio crassostreae]